MSLQQVLAEVLSMKAEIASLKAMIASGNISSNASVVSVASKDTPKEGKTKAKRQVKKDENGKPLLNKWTRFSQRVCLIMKEAGFVGGQDGIAFAKELKDKAEKEEKAYEKYTDEEIKEQLKGFTAPEPVKRGSGKPKKTKEAVPATLISSPGDEEHVSNVGATVVPSSPAASVIAREEVNFGDDEEDEEPQADEWDNIVFKGKKYMFNKANGHCYHRDPQTDARLGWAGIFNPKDPKSGKPALDSTKEEPEA